MDPEMQLQVTDCKPVWKDKSGKQIYQWLIPVYGKEKAIYYCDLDMTEQTPFMAAFGLTYGHGTLGLRLLRVLDNTDKMEV